MKIRKRKALASSGKKGNAVVDTITVVVSIFVFVLIIYFGSKVFSDFRDDVNTEDSLSNESIDLINTQEARYNSLFDGLFITFLILIWALVIVASFTIDANPIFFIFTVVLLLIVLFISLILGNAYEEINQESSLAGVSAGFPMTSFVWEHILLVIIVIAFSIVIVLFGKRQLQ